jgi:hypothetical protein
VLADFVDTSEPAETGDAHLRQLLVEGA